MPNGSKFRALCPAQQCSCTLITDCSRKHRCCRHVQPGMHCHARRGYPAHRPRPQVGIADRHAPASASTFGILKGLGAAAQVATLTNGSVSSSQSILERTGVASLISEARRSSHLHRLLSSCAHVQLHTLPVQATWA